MSSKVINVSEIDISGDALEEIRDSEASPELSEEQVAYKQRLAKLMLTNFLNTNKNWKRIFKGFPSNGKVKISKYWMYGSLVPHEEYIKLSWEEKHEHNNQVSGRKYKTRN